MHALDDAISGLPRMLPVSSVTNWQKKYTCLPRKNNFYLRFIKQNKLSKDCVTKIKGWERNLMKKTL